MDDNWKERAFRLTYYHGFDKVIEVVGYPEKLKMCFGITRPSGTITAMDASCEQRLNLVLAYIFSKYKFSYEHF